MTEILDNLPPAVMLVLALLLVVWLVLLLLVPFMIESIRGWTRKSYGELEQLNKKIDRLIVLLGERADAATLRPLERPAREPRAERTERARKEPTISG
jgi:hypothetical protein